MLPKVHRFYTGCDTTGTPGTLNWLPAGPTVTRLSAQRTPAHSCSLAETVLCRISVEVDVAPYSTTASGQQPGFMQRFSGYS
jgi:hypothetical protein